MVSVNLLSQHLREVHFVNDLNQTGQIQLQNSFNFHVDYSKDNKRCVAKLYQRAQMKDDPDKLFISAEILGVFTLEGVQTTEDKQEAHVQCYNAIFPYLQSAVSQLAAAGGLNNFMLKKNAMAKENVILAKKEKPQETPPEEKPPMTLPIV